MPSTDRSRRELLSLTGSSLAVATGAALAGCAGTHGTAPDDEPDDVAHDVSERPPGRSELEDDDDVLFVRASHADPFVFESEADVPDDDRAFFRGSFHVVSDEEAADLYVDAPADDADAIEQFVEATDFETQSIFVDQRTIGDCYDRVFLGAEASDGSLRTAYCRSLKSPTTPCAADREVMEAVIVRLGRPYDDPPSSRQSSEHGSCSPTVDVEMEPNAAAAEEPDDANPGDGDSDDADGGDETTSSIRVGEVSR